MKPARIEAIEGEMAKVEVVSGGYHEAVRRSAADAGERCLVISDTSWESVVARRLITLEHPQDSIMSGLNCDTPSLVAWPLVSRGIDVYVAVPDQRVPGAMRLLANDEIKAGEMGRRVWPG
jgi:hypothetical protein